jgi:hypothetical protein
MSFFKSLLLAIITTVLLTYFLGASFLEFFGIDGVTDANIKDGVLAPIQAISVSALISVLLIIAGLAVVLSVFGSIFLVMMLVFGVVVMAMIGAFWPILLVGFVIWLMVRDTSKAAYS